MSRGEVRLTVVVPAFQEAATIATTVSSLRAALQGVASAGGLEVVVADDGSTDQSGDLAKRAGADKVLRLEHKGKGAAVRAGAMAASGRTVAFIDADLAYAPTQLNRLLAEVESGWDVVVGSRRHVDTVTLVRARRLREVSGRVFNTLTRMVLRAGHHDTQCGIKAFSAEATRAIFSRARVDGFAFDVELFVLADRLGLSLTEVPVELTNSIRSSVRMGRDTVQMLKDVARIRWMAYRGGYGPLVTPTEREGARL